MTRWLMLIRYLEWRSKVLIGTGRVPRKNSNARSSLTQILRTQIPCTALFWYTLVELAKLSITLSALKNCLTQAMGPFLVTIKKGTFISISDNLSWRLNL